MVSAGVRAEAVQEAGQHQGDLDATGVTPLLDLVNTGGAAGALPGGTK